MNTEATRDDTHLRPVPDTSGRGLTRMPPLPSEYGGTVQVYESSAASSPHIWLSIESPVGLDKPGSRMINASSHLAIENAQRLAEQIIYLAENHYQVSDG